ncbi:MAG TPA: efflux RND transporter periplasmic adaptor subunit [Vicinamibacterales bacterium]|nr:efflux RND transporter periplasmic adaptor subunit [Vicinamibacterales bacterium]
MTMWPARTGGRLVVVATAGVVAAGGWWLSPLSGSAPDVPAAVVTRGDYVDVLEIRGDVRPQKSVVVNAPYNAGELQILKLLPNGTAVKQGDVVAEFDAVVFKRTVAEKESELRSAIAEREQAIAQAEIDEKDKQAAIRRGEFDVERARLALGNIELVAEVEAERAKLALADAQQRLHEATAGAESARVGRAGQFEARDRRIERIEADLARARRALTALEVTAPTDGTISIMPNYRFWTPSGPLDYKPGDRAWPGAAILELPDLRTVYLLARLDEGERGPIKTGLEATIRADAVPDREYAAVVSDISLLARPDYTEWPPAKMFDVRLTFKDPDDRLRPGMSAMARIPVGSLANVLLVPAEAVFTRDGRPVVYKVGRRSVDPVPVDVVRRGRSQAAIEGAIAPGDRVALVEPATVGSAGGGV